MNLFTKKEADSTELDSELIVARGEELGMGWGGIVGELGIDIIHCYI